MNIRLSLRLSLLVLCTSIAASCGVASAPGQNVATAVATIEQPTLELVPTADIAPASTTVPVEQPQPDAPQLVTPTILEPTASAVQGEQPAAIAPCTFPLPQSVQAGQEPVVPPLEAYQISTTTFLTGSTNELLRVIEWLPDNQSLLVIRSRSDKYEDAIEVINTITGAITSYGTVPFIVSRPYWIEAEQAVLVPEAKFNNRNGIGGATLTLRKADGTITMLEPNLLNPFIALSADRAIITLLNQQQPFQPQRLTLTASRQIASLPSLESSGLVDTISQNASNFQGDPWYTPRFAWRPDGTSAVIYSQDGTFLIDTTSQQTCRIDLGGEQVQPRWAMDVQWSPDGKYIAFQSSIYRERGSIHTIEITILDTTTGILTNLDTSFRFNYGFVWLPNSQQLFILGGGTTSDGYATSQLSMADLRNGILREVLPNQYLSSFEYEGGGGLAALSNDGKRLAISCLPAQIATTNNVCLVDLVTQQ